MNKTTIVIFLALFVTVPSRAQSVADLRAKFPTVTAYEIRPGVVMTAKYDAVGQVCEMVIERQHVTHTGINFDSFLSKEVVKELIDQLAPPSERGKELTGLENWFGSVIIDGGFITTNYGYENVLVRVYGITRPEPAGDMVVTITWRKRACSGVQQSANSILKLRGEPARSTTLRLRSSESSWAD